MKLWLMDNPSNSVDGGSGLGITLNNPAVHARCSFLKGLGEWAPVDKLRPPRAGASPAEHHPRHGARLGPLHEPPALHLPCLSLVSLGEKNLQVVNIFLNSNPARSNMKIFCCFSPFLGSIAHLKKISGALETPRARIGVELGGAPSLAGGGNKLTYCAPEGMEKWEKTEFEHKNGFCCSWMRCAKRWWKSSWVSPAGSRGVTTTGGVCLAVHIILIQN